MAEIVVVAEGLEGQISPASLEACTAAATLAHGDTWAVAIAGNAAVSAADYAPRVYTETEPGLFRLPDQWVNFLSSICAEARVVLAPATATGRDILARLAQILDVSLQQDCTKARRGDSALTFERPLYGGKVTSTIAVDSTPVLATIRPRAYAPVPRRANPGQVVPKTVPIPASSIVWAITQSARRGRPDVTEAAIVVSGGRGMQGPEHWGLLEDLVEACGPTATLACSRPVSDDGWRPRNEHVGQTGRAIAPDLYIAVGISGAIQHLAGIAGSKCILAINKDPDAPIFRIADYGIVGDLFEVIPALTAAIELSG